MTIVPEPTAIWVHFDRASGAILAHGRCQQSVAEQHCADRVDETSDTLILEDAPYSPLLWQTHKVVDGGLVPVS